VISTKNRIRHQKQRSEQLYLLADEMDREGARAAADHKLQSRGGAQSYSFRQPKNVPAASMSLALHAWSRMSMNAW
jgi:hypothetical protein